MFGHQDAIPSSRPVFVRKSYPIQAYLCYCLIHFVVNPRFKSKQIQSSFINLTDFDQLFY